MIPSIHLGTLARLVVLALALTTAAAQGDGAAPLPAVDNPIIYPNNTSWYAKLSLALLWSLLLWRLQNLVSFIIKRPFTIPSHHLSPYATLLLLELLIYLILQEPDRAGCYLHKFRIRTDGFLRPFTTSRDLYRLSDRLFQSRRFRNGMGARQKLYFQMHGLAASRRRSSFK